MKGSLRVSASPAAQVHEISAPDGSTIREYALANGTVFAVAWSTRLKPDLESLLGKYHIDYAAAAGEAMRRPGIRRRAALARGDLVVHSSGYLNTFSGKAYVPSLVPAGFNIDGIR